MGVLLLLPAPPRRLPSLDPRRYSHYPPRQDRRPAGGRCLLGSRPVDQQRPEPASLASPSSFGRRFVAPPALWPVPLRRSTPEHRRQHPRVILLPSAVHLFDLSAPSTRPQRKSINLESTIYEHNLNQPSLPTLLP